MIIHELEARLQRPVISASRQAQERMPFPGCSGWKTCSHTQHVLSVVRKQKVMAHLRALLLKPHPGSSHTVRTSRSRFISSFIRTLCSSNTQGMFAMFERNSTLSKAWRIKSSLINGALYVCLLSCLLKWAPFQLEQAQFFHLGQNPQCADSPGQYFTV